MLAADAAEEEDASDISIDSDFSGSSDDDIELYEYENEITSKYWMPSEARLFCIYNGRSFINFNDD